jgi:hypothetical protein
MIIKMKPYPELRGLLKKYNMTYDDYAAFLGKSKNLIGLKMQDKVAFRQTECKMTVDFFKGKREKWVTIEKLFFAWRSTIVDKEVSAV